MVAALALGERENEYGAREYGAREYRTCECGACEEGACEYDCESYSQNTFKTGTAAGGQDRDTGGRTARAAGRTRQAGCEEVLIFFYRGDRETSCCVRKEKGERKREVGDGCF